jgi:Condensation domain
MAEARPLSAGQQAMWLLHRLDPDSSAYNVVLAARIRGGLDPRRLRRAVHATAQRHEMIRSEFTEADGEPQRLVRGPDTVRLDVHDVHQPDLLDAPVAEACCSTRCRCLPRNCWPRPGSFTRPATPRGQAGGPPQLVAAGVRRTAGRHPDPP